MNDIQLRRVTENKYDWVFGVEDIREVIGRRQLQNAVKHAILLQRNESDLLLYKDKGLQDYVLKDMDEETITILEEEIKIVVKEIETVEDVEVEITRNPEDMKELNIKLTILRKDGSEVKIDAI